MRRLKTRVSDVAISYISFDSGSLVSVVTRNVLWTKIIHQFQVNCNYFFGEDPKN